MKILSNKNEYFWTLVIETDPWVEKKSNLYNLQNYSHHAKQWLSTYFITAPHLLHSLYPSMYYKYI